jgi:hypothetical protein
MFGKQNVDKSGRGFRSFLCVVVICLRFFCGSRNEYKSSMKPLKAQKDCEENFNGKNNWIFLFENFFIKF